jgi:uncharacterized protein (TIGR03435 family)
MSLKHALAGVALFFGCYGNGILLVAEPSAACSGLDANQMAPLSFEVVSIKPGHDDGWQTRFTESGFDGSSVPVQYLLRIAFGPAVAPPDILNLPKWAHETYDIQAKVAAEDLPRYKLLTREQQGGMIRQILCDRFKLKFHYGTTEHPVYDLLIADEDSKLRKMKAVTGYIGTGSNEPLIPANGMLQFRADPDSLAHLARRLSWTNDVENRIVLDRTGLLGFFDFELSWCPLSDRSDSQGPSCEGASLFTALKEQLGLKLKPSIASFQTLIVDQIEKPSPN